MKRVTSRSLFVVATAFAALPAAAQNCLSNVNPFVDVGAGQLFCGEALWLRNALVTLGCNADSYCPTANVTRAQMALFMRRLATAVRPELVLAESTSGSFLDIDPGAVMCAHSSLSISLGDDGANARLAHVRANVSLQTTAAADIELRITRSDNGGPFVPDAQAFSAATSAGTGWVHLTTMSGPRTITPPPAGGTPVSSRWRLELSRVAGSATTGDSRSSAAR